VRYEKLPFGSATFYFMRLINSLAKSRISQKK